MSEIADGYDVIASAEVFVSGVSRSFGYADEPFILCGATLRVNGGDGEGKFQLSGRLPELSIKEPLTLILVRKTPASDGV